MILKFAIIIIIKIIMNLLSSFNDCDMNNYRTWVLLLSIFFFRLFCGFFFVSDNNFILCIINEELKSFYALENTHIYCYNRTAYRVLKRLEVWQLHIPILCKEFEGQILPLVL